MRIPTLTLELIDIILARITRLIILLKIIKHMMTPATVNLKKGKGSIKLSLRSLKRKLYPVFLILLMVTCAVSIVTTESIPTLALETSLFTQGYNWEIKEEQELSSSTRNQGNNLMLKRTVYVNKFTPIALKHFPTFS